MDKKRMLKDWKSFKKLNSDFTGRLSLLYRDFKRQYEKFQNIDFMQNFAKLEDNIISQDRFCLNDFWIYVRYGWIDEDVYNEFEEMINKANNKLARIDEREYYTILEILKDKDFLSYQDIYCFIEWAKNPSYVEGLRLFN